MFNKGTIMNTAGVMGSIIHIVVFRNIILLSSIIHGLHLPGIISAGRPLSPEDDFMEPALT